MWCNQHSCVTHRSKCDTHLGWPCRYIFSELDQRSEWDISPFSWSCSCNIRHNQVSRATNQWHSFHQIMSHNLGVSFCKGCNSCLSVHIGFDGTRLSGTNEENGTFIDSFNYNDTSSKAKWSNKLLTRCLWLHTTITGHILEPLARHGGHREKIRILTLHGVIPIKSWIWTIDVLAAVVLFW